MSWIITISDHCVCEGYSMVRNDCYVNLDAEEDTELCDECGSDDIYVYHNGEN